MVVNGNSEWEVLISIPESQIGGKNELNVANEVPSWISDQRHSYVQMIKLCLPETYSRLRLIDANIWKKFSQSGDWESIPAEVGLTPFQKVILVWATKPDKLYSSLMKAASQILGVNQLLPGGDILSVVERWGSPEQPILVIGTEDNDPIDQIKTKAAHFVGIDNYRQVWLSAEDQQSEESTRETVRWAEKCGGWAVVSVGVGAWSAAERVLLAQRHDILEPHSRTRVWIVAEDGASVPPLFATACINVVMEAPAGIRNNIIRTLSLWSPQSGKVQGLDGHGDGDPKRVRLEFSLGLVHSIIQERCSYIPQGWRAKYGFSWGDASAGWVAVRSATRATAGGLCAAMYSGRVTCQRDAALATALIAKHFDEEVAGHKWKPLGIDIALPMTRHLQDYMAVLSNFPVNDSPAQLGLPNNIHRAKEQQAGSDVITQLKSYSHGEASLHQDHKLLKKKLMPIFSLWKKINSGTDSLVKAKVSDVKFKADSSGLTALAVQEWTAAVSAVKKVHSDLAALRNPTSITDKAFRHLAEELITDQTPEPWMSYWAGGQRSASRFLVGLCDRAGHAQRSISNGSAISQLPSLKSLLRPERVPFALRWEATLRLGVPPDRLVPVTTWGDGDADPTIAKIVLKDLWLEGAIWESGRLQPCRSDSPTPTPAPPISLKFVPAESINERFKENIVEIPIYTSSDRIELVFNVGAPSADQFNTNLWLLNSTALIIP